MYAFREHKVKWIRALVGNSAKFPDALQLGRDKPAPTITRYQVTDVTKQYREG